ncbi:MAG TPA: acyl-CoA thioesterase [Ktedonobacterales bacterium]|jgi:acyl-CoA thioester hydrolase
MSRNTIHYQVQWGDTDAAGIVFYPNFFRWFDHAALEFLRSLGAPLEMLKTHYHVLAPVIEVGCRFQKPLRYHDLLTIETTATEVRTRSFRLEHRVLRDNEVAGIGYEVRGLARIPTDDQSKLELIPIPDHIRALLR